MTKAPSKPILVSCTSVFALCLFASPAYAQISAGDEIRDEMERLTTRLQDLEERLEGMDGASEGELVTSGNDKIEVSLSGQINRGILYGDDGKSADYFFVDNDNSSTRLRVTGVGRFDPEWSVGTVIEVQFESNSTAAISMTQDSPAGPNNFTERKLEIFADSKRLGRLWLGQGSTATDGTAELDLSGTEVIAYSAVQDMAGGLAFRTQAGAFGPEIGDVYSNMDGLGRDDRIRYDTPNLLGLTGSVGAVDGGSWDAGLVYTRKFGTTNFAGGLGYANAESRQGYTQLSGSASLEFPMGITVTGAAGTRDIDGAARDPFFYYTKLAYAMTPFELGGTMIGIDWAYAEDIAQGGDEFNAVGLFGVQEIDRIATDVYVGARWHELDRSGAEYEDIWAMLTGARVKF